jgi:hypothetical protein
LITLISKNYGSIHVTICCLLSIIFLVGVISETKKMYSKSAFTNSNLIGKIFLDPAAEDRRVSERASALERVSSDTNTFWSSARRRHVVVRLQDRAQHIEEAVEGCRRSLTTMFSVM